MGTRIAYRVADSEGEIVATLYSNSSHTSQFAENVFRATLQVAQGPTDLVELLLQNRYRSAEGAHKNDDRIFVLVPASESEAGDREKVVTATYGAGHSSEGLTKYLAAQPAWSVMESD